MKVDDEIVTIKMLMIKKLLKNRTMGGVNKSLLEIQKLFESVKEEVRDDPEKFIDDDELTDEEGEEFIERFMEYGLIISNDNYDKELEKQIEELIKSR